jgi:hypothetical protein
MKTTYVHRLYEKEGREMPFTVLSAGELLSQVRYDLIFVDQELFISDPDPDSTFQSVPCPATDQQVNISATTLTHFEVENPDKKLDY